MNESLWKIVDSYLRSNDVDAAAADLESRLRTAASDRFRSLADAHFTNPPVSVLVHINGFLRACQAKFPVAAVYLEMNGF